MNNAIAHPAGMCPACGNRTLTVQAAHFTLRCTDPGCPRPTLLAELLEQPDLHRHIVDLLPERFHTQHPVTCRIDGLTACPVDGFISALDAPPAPLGRYYADLTTDDVLTLQHVRGGAPITVRDNT
jgi:hypothetical protein